VLYTSNAQLAQSVLDATLRDGGATFTVNGSQSGAPLYAVSIYPEREQIIRDVPTLDDITRYLDANADLISERNAVGTWMHDGKCYLDISRLVPTESEALALGARYGQLAVFNLATFDEIPVPTTVGVGVAA
jgi:hypothetical protein